MQFDKHTLIYIQIADFIRARIMDGSWQSGERIPSIRDMAMQLEVNPNTVTRTYQLLQDEGTIENQRGIGYFVSATAEEALAQKKRTEFLSSTLPRLFQEMDALGITLQDIAGQYQRRTSLQEKSNEQDK